MYFHATPVHRYNPSPLPGFQSVPFAYANRPVCGFAGANLPKLGFVGSVLCRTFPVATSSWSHCCHWGLERGSVPLGDCLIITTSRNRESRIGNRGSAKNRFAFRLSRLPSCRVPSYKNFFYRVGDGH